MCCDRLHLIDYVKDADVVITGEGLTDAQSIMGKTPIGVARTAKQFNKPVIAIAGCLREDYDVVFDHGIDAVFPIIHQLWRFIGYSQTRRTKFNFYRSKCGESTGI